MWRLLQFLPIKLNDLKHNWLSDMEMLGFAGYCLIYFPHCWAIRIIYDSEIRIDFSNVHSIKMKFIYAFDWPVTRWVRTFVGQKTNATTIFQIVSQLFGYQSRCFMSMLIGRWAWFSSISALPPGSINGQWRHLNSFSIHLLAIFNRSVHVTNQWRHGKGEWPTVRHFLRMCEKKKHI